jgi:hypothetical protein
MDREPSGSLPANYASDGSSRRRLQGAGGAETIIVKNAAKD